jgi:hypothetical protein
VWAGSFDYNPLEEKGKHGPLSINSSDRE